eukprot:scaffold22381_cov36-Cyclotella_meneghiniana.AAC.2
MVQQNSKTLGMLSTMQLNRLAQLSYSCACGSNVVVEAIQQQHDFHFVGEVACGTRLIENLGSKKFKKIMCVARVKIGSLFGGLPPKAGEDSPLFLHEHTPHTMMSFFHIIDGTFMLSREQLDTCCAVNLLQQ